MKKRVLALILASVITLTNGNIVFAAEANVENTTDTMVMERAVGESTQPKLEEDTESEEQEEVAEDDPAENEDVDVTNTVTREENEEVNTTNTVVAAEKIEESIATTTSESTENITVETSEDVPEQGYAKSGTYGENITWTFDDSTGTLTFSGRGDMADTPAGEYTPWEKNFRTEVKHIIINDGITNIGMNAFYAIDKAVDISIPQSVTVIKKGALQGCESIKELRLPNKLTNIGIEAFFLMGSCKGFYIDAPETAYHTENGVLFCNRTLITYPQGNTRDSYRVPYGTEKLEGLAFANTTYLQTVYIPETMTRMYDKMFSDESNGATHMEHPLKIYFCTTEMIDQFGMSNFNEISKGSRIYVKNQETCNQINNSSAITNKDDDVRAEVYQQTEPYSAYEALRKTYANGTYRLNSGRTTLFRYEAADAPTATDTTAWTSSNTDIANSPNGMGYITGGTKPGTATITVTREDKKETFSFKVVNVVPTTSIELYHQVKGKQQVLGNSLCIRTGKSDTVSLQTVPGITTALLKGVTWSVTDPSKVSVKTEGTYHEKATLYRKATGDVTVTASLKDEKGKEFKKTFQVTGNKSTEDWYISVNNNKDVLVKNSKPVTPAVVVKDGGTVLKEKVDYTVRYSDNYLPDGDSMQWGDVIVTPIGEYRGNSDIIQAFLIFFDESGDVQPTDPKDPQKTKNPSTSSKRKKQKITKVSSTYKKSIGQSFTLKPKAKGKITYKTGNKKVATVNSKGKVTVKGTGKATITVTAKATSTYSKCVKKITIYGVPKKPEMKKLTAGKKKFMVQWKKDKKADGYQVQYSTDKKFKKNVKSVNVSKKSTKTTVKKLKKGKTYRVRMRSYKKINGKKYYSGWGKVKSVKVK